MYYDIVECDICNAHTMGWMMMVMVMVMNRMRWIECDAIGCDGCWFTPAWNFDAESLAHVHELKLPVIMSNLITSMKKML